MGRDLLLLAGINAAVIAGLLVIHGCFKFAGREVTFLPIALLFARLLLVVPETIFARRSMTKESLVSLRHFYRSTTIFNLVFAFVISNASHIHDTHYHVLVLVPILATAVHSSIWRTLAVAAIGSSFGFLQVYIYFYRNPPVDDEEYFEAAEISIMFLVVAGLTWLLIRRLRQDRQRLAQSLAELKETQMKLVERERVAAIGELAGSIAHEIRNPVAMIASSLQMYDRQSSSPGAREEMLRIAQGESARLERLTTDFLTFARARPPTRTSQSLAPQIDYVSSVARARATSKGIEIRASCSTSLTASFDAHQLQQALLNLLYNAIDASPPNQSITIDCIDGSAYETRIRVTNAGPAISPEHLTKIFSPFYTTKGSGTGLGLPIARKIAEAHGGTLHLVQNVQDSITFELSIRTADEMPTSPTVAQAFEEN